MQYIISFLEGIITFISPCLLPMLPIFISYFAGSQTEDMTVSKTGDKDSEKEAGSNKNALKNAFGFITGFTLVFLLLGAFAGVLGKFLRQNQTVVNISTGVIVVLFGLHHMEVLQIPFINRVSKRNKGSITGFFSALLFGIVFSISWTPCVGVFLGSALMLASQRGSAAEGILMLLCYSLGLGIPFLISAILIERLKAAFTFIKKHYKIINIVSGLFLILMGILMATGMMGRFLALLS